MEKNLIDFMEKVNILNKNFSEYRDEEKGFYFVIGTAQLLCSCEYIELDALQLKNALFNKEIEKGQVFNKITVKRPVPKDTVTKKDDDKYTLIEKDIEVSQIWFVRNQLKLSKAFDNKEDALAYANKMNEKVMNIIKGE